MDEVRNIRLRLTYDGTNYVGWQVQPNGPSVQAALESAIEKLTGESVRVMSAGRTDSGVHAQGQVANFHTRSSIPVEKFPPALENFLPDDIAVWDADLVPDDFHATYWAIEKRYRYVILNSRQRVPVLRNYALRDGRQLDVDAMQQAAKELIGTHDFRCFESEYGRRASSVRTVHEATFNQCDGWPVWQPPTPAGRARRDPTGRSPSALQGCFITFDIVADGFLYNMVRAIVGTLLHVGRGRWDAGDVRRIIESRDRSQAGETAPPQGLYMLEVHYDEERIANGLNSGRTPADVDGGAESNA